MSAPELLQTMRFLSQSDGERKNLLEAAINQESIHLFCPFSGKQKFHSSFLPAFYVRIKTQGASSGMPLYKYFSNRLLTILENLIAGQNLSEWHTGYRAYSRKILEKIPYHKNSDYLKG